MSERQTVKVYVLSNGAKASGCVIAVDDACPLDVGDEEVERASIELMKMAEAGVPDAFGDGWRVVELSGEVMDGDFVTDEVWTSARILSPHAGRQLVFPVWPKKQTPDEECAYASPVLGWTIIPASESGFDTLLTPESAQRHTTHPSTAPDVPIRARRCGGLVHRRRGRDPHHARVQARGRSMSSPSMKVDVEALRKLADEIDAALDADCMPEVTSRHSAALRGCIKKIEAADHIIAHIARNGAPVADFQAKVRVARDAFNSIRNALHRLRHECHIPAEHDDHLDAIGVEVVNALHAIGNDW